MIAWVRREPGLFRDERTWLTIGMKKQSDLPDPVPVVTTKLSP
jgi:hypothetical protein